MREKWEDFKAGAIFLLILLFVISCMEAKGSNEPDPCFAMASSHFC